MFELEREEVCEWRGPGFVILFCAAITSYRWRVFVCLRVCVCMCTSRFVCEAGMCMLGGGVM